jgi:muconolactone D-isomerase
MQFLVHMVVTWPPDGDPDELQRRVAGEQQRARELAAAGTIERLWRVPGQWANWGIWEAPDATALHDAVTSLPMWPYLKVEVHPLALHPNDPGATSVPGPDQG